jgi:hypothetical protein
VVCSPDTDCADYNRYRRFATSLFEVISMVAVLVLVLAALSRLLPHAMHIAGLNITAVGGGLLFFGSRAPRWQAAIAAAVMALTDVYLTTVVYGLPFHVSGYLVTWAWYAAVCLLASGLLRKVTALRVAAGVFASATSFFLLSNFMCWASGMYEHSLGGLALCYRLAVPFYANDLASTAVVSGVLFGLPVVAAKMVQALRQNHAAEHVA